MSDYRLYQEKAKAQLEEWEADLDKLRAKARQKEADDKIHLEEKIRDLEMKLEKGKTKYNELKASGGSAWESVKEGMDAAWNDLTSAFKEAKSKF